MTAPLARAQNSSRKLGIAALELATASNLHAAGKDQFTSTGNNRMDDKASLLNQLRIDRTEEPESENGRGPLIWIGVAVAVLIGAFLVYWYAIRDTGIPIKVATAREIAGATASRGASTLDASGYVVARRQATVSSKITGKVLEVLIEEGQRVHKDQIIARLDDSNYRTAYEQAKAQLAQAQANVHSAQVALENARPVFERNKKQLDAGVISAQAFDTAKATYDSTETALAVAQRAEEVARAALAVAQQNLADTVIRAPYDGVVTVKAAQAGEIVSPMSAGGGFTRTGIGTIVDMNSLELEVDVSENFINRVKPNQPAVVKLNAYPDWEIPAEVIAVIPTADRAKATVKVRIGFKVKDARILPEMGARVSFLEESANNGANKTAAAAPAVVIPPEAIQATGDTGVVYIVNDDKVERRAVRLGAKTNDGQIVLAGLNSGARVAIGDFNLLKDQATVRIEE